MLANASAYWGAVELGEQLDQAMRSRASIEQAKGVIMGSMGCSADDAFGVLRQQSQSENRKLHDVAEEVVAHQRRAGTSSKQHPQGSPPKGPAETP